MKSRKRILCNLFLFFSVLFVFSLPMVDDEARNFYLEAMKAYGNNDEKNALLNYEKAFFKDGKIQIYDDKGLLDKLTLKYMEIINKKLEPDALFKIAHIMRMRGNYENSINFYKLFIENFRDDREKISHAVSMIQEMEFAMNFNKNQNQNQNLTQPTSEIQSQIPAQNQSEQSKISSQQKPDEEKKDTVTTEKERERNRQIEQKKNEVAKLQNEYDLWFSLTYGKHDYQKKDYYEAMVHFYNSKLQKAQQELKELSKDNK
ncbi:MAG: hypothetical protein WC002_02395 [Candidatus Muiribacteriota bacterium]